MIKSILTSALRNIFRNRSFSTINLIGLAISMSLGLLIILVVKSQYSFDNFHEDANKVYRINTEALRASGGTESYASVPLAIASALQEEYAYADELVRLDRQFRGEVKRGESFLRIRGLYADPSFLSVFNFPLQHGTKSTVLESNNSVVLTHDAAIKFFGDQDPINQLLTVDGLGDFTVTGVLEPFKSPTHFEFEALVSMSSLEVLAKEGRARKPDDLKNYYTGYAYLKLKEGISTVDVEAALETTTKKYYADVDYETRDKGYRFYLQPLTGITPGPVLSNNMGTGMPDLLLVFMMALAGIVLIMACFNYTQLMIAKSLTRAREIGVRKIVGAHRWQVFIQFVSEAVVFSFLALIVSYGLLQLIKPAFLQLHITQEFTVNLTEDYSILLIFLGFAILVGGIAGLLPAVYLSTFKPLKVLRSGDLKISSRLTLRKILMTVQFTLSLIFILVVMTIYSQINYMLEADYGFDDQNLVNVRLGAQEFEKFATEIQSISGIESVGGVSHSLGTWEDGGSDYKRNLEDELFGMRDFSVDENYLRNLKVDMVAGSHFQAGRENQVILNETALKQFGFERAVDAIDQIIFMDDSTQLSIVGVVPDFNFRPLSYEIGPVAFRYAPQDISILTARVNPNNTKAVIAQMGAAWNKLDTRPFEWMMVSDEIDKAYEDAGFFDILSIVGYITVVAITLACLGILGMAMYMAQTRVKEIGVRKVMGASVPDILFLLSKTFLIVIGISVVIGVPVSFFLGDMFLNMYAYRIPVTPWMILSGILFLVMLAMIMVASQTVRAATTNPVKSLRYE